MSNRFDAHDAANRARDIRGAYMVNALSDMTPLSVMIKSALCALAAKAPLAGHRV